jgi:hypothetical protein
MQTTRYALLPVEVLWEYREFKRDETPAPDVPFIHSRSMGEIMSYVKANGFEPLDLSIVKDRALLIDGNHRIVAAKRLGLDFIPVNVTVIFGDGSHEFYKHTLSRFKLIKEDLEPYLKELFIEDIYTWDKRPKTPFGKI